MDASQSALDSLRTVEFRETLKGYHRDDVDEYLEKAAVEAEGLQEQLRQSGERLRQAAERISQLETALEQQPAPQPAEPAVPDDTLQRTLVLAQQFVDQTKADAEAEAARTIANAESSARKMTEQAQAQASQIASESEQRLRDEINRLEDSRTRLTHDVEAMSRHLEGERNRLRTALSEILRWVDENVQQVSAPADLQAGKDPGGGSGVAPSPAPAPAPAPTPAPAPAPAAAPEDGSRVVAAQPQDAPSAGPGSSGATAEVTQMRPAGAAPRPAATDAVLPL
ncbi:MAG: DivIVA domain-containing protein [Acidimicrobiales bacterium]|jgi:DivIVA domain-containing protein